MIDYQTENVFQVNVELSVALSSQTDLCAQHTGALPLYLLGVSPSSMPPGNFSDFLSVVTIMPGQCSSTESVKYKKKLHILTTESCIS